ncbi:bifunctional phosphoribosylaminoimidazolecarboxamide formyltransferase/IMP cyclohydrolase PurH [Coxiella endosymbiont of Amblyomma sculptum]|uniref:bifunctional phosphoribosylaminoimidazolecarboxamide formyltransferase/IMP cyclohydrolase n=1 Tax=Coxiella endosymbiont of Amblyomma sculptum TaxID=2487929 RepID=UPI00132EAAD1|nr:bifunctional phosphoribosylaminoimidazolecarboxamide formyltransferase/IMP cyclohydrolase [Coxiella endosymbiont of Amblyomma sculptum]QHG92485.1 bifunctional phosphoribosylaminoimidazolecarboxamide formyltransferase/IMP cyclohydrolase PurH [Coxiella endosymbiont of Amblyomma sculptum]
MNTSSHQRKPITRALISVSDKTDIIDFAKELNSRCIEIVATSGTANLLKLHRIPVTDIATFTGFPEILNGRVKTLHPKVYAGLLARPGFDDNILKQHTIYPIDLLVVNFRFYTTEVTVPLCIFEETVEQIDIGGPSMLRAGVKNFRSVTVLVEPSDYKLVLQEMDTNLNATSLSFRRSLAQKALEYLSNYDAAILSCSVREYKSKKSLSFPEGLPVTFQKKAKLRYGENPNQSAVLYRVIPPVPNSLTESRQLQGKPLSFSNLLDGDCAYRTVWEEQDAIIPTCVIVKHASPCGAAQGENQLVAYEKAYATDSLSVFGGIVAFNSVLESETAKKILEKHFVEIIIAPSFTIDSLRLLKKKPYLRLLEARPPVSDDCSFSFCSITGGLLVQKNEQTKSNRKNFTVVSQRLPSKRELQDLYFAWNIVKYVKSNAIVCTKNQTTLGIGSGQSSRVFSVKIAIMKAQEAGFSLENSAMASDAFFPFTDGIKTAKKAGIRAIIQPGGSIRDREIVRAANSAEIAMVFTHQRCFKH